MERSALSNALKNVRTTTPLVHCITNYVTVNDCANALLACGGSPIMSDEPLDVFDIQTICGGLVLNIGTLNEHTIEGMRVPGAQRPSWGIPSCSIPWAQGHRRCALKRQASCSTVTTSKSFAATCPR